MIEAIVESVAFITGATFYGIGVALGTSDGREGEGALGLILIGAVLIQVSLLL